MVVHIGIGIDLESFLIRVFDTITKETINIDLSVSSGVVGFRFILGSVFGSNRKLKNRWLRFPLGAPTTLASPFPTPKSKQSVQDFLPDLD